MKHWTKWIQKHRKQIELYGIIILSVLILIFLFFDVILAAGIITGFIAANILLRMYRRILPGVPIEFEVVIMGGMICTIAFGIWAGLLVVIFGSILAEFLNQFISPHSLVNFAVYFFIPFIALFIPTGSIATAGFIVAIVANIVIFIVFLLMGYDLVKNLAFSITNIFWNYLMFKYLAGILLALLI
ncbi:hypothetical protein H6503_06460 [Candidatus Woesearchaeota archaeon]|nr:hypothetical protein [Candidatus Woesearchaeota archaeon]